MATLGAELGCERYLASTVVTGSGQRSSTLLAELCLSTVLVLALLAFHCRPRRKKRARCTATVTSRMADCSTRAMSGHAAAAPSDGDCHTPLLCEVRKGKDTTRQRAVLSRRFTAAKSIES